MVYTLCMCDFIYVYVNHNLLLIVIFNDLKYTLTQEVKTKVSELTNYSS